MLPDYKAFTPATLEEALAALAGPDKVTPMAGGTNVVVAMREGAFHGHILMDVTGLHELRGIRRENGHLVIGAGATVAQLLASPLIASAAPPLLQAARTFANPLIRNRATVAGNIVDASPAADTAPALLVLDAEVELRGTEGSRRVALDRFFLGPNHTVRRADELVTDIRWPVPPPDCAGAFHKLALRKGTACSVLSAAVMVRTGDLGRVSKCRIALGAVADRPVRVHEAENSLEGQILAPASIDAAAGLCASAAQPIDDVRGSAAYRQRLVAVLVRRLLAGAAAALAGE
jgi:CO/xanthine dehydrogenase FAD-binding subunit